MKCCGSVTASGMAARHGWLFRYTPEVEGRTPVISDARDGLQAGAWQ